MTKKQSYEWLAKDFTEGNEGILTETSKGPFLVRFQPCGEHYQLEGTGPLSLDKVLGCSSCRSYTEYGLSNKGVTLPSLSQVGTQDYEVVNTSKEGWSGNTNVEDIGLLYRDQSLSRPLVNTPIPDFVSRLE